MTLIKFPSAQATQSVFENVWFWGNPILKPPKSFASYLVEPTYTVFREVVSRNFGRLLSQWRQELVRVKTDEYELLKVMLLEREALSNDYSNVLGYIANRLDPPCSMSRVSRLLQLVSLAQMDDQLTNYENEPRKSASIIDGHQTTWRPSEAMIQKKRVTIPRMCAGSFKGCRGETNTGKLALCYNCHTKALIEYGSSKNFPYWLHEEIKRIKNEHREQVINACIEDYYGTVSIEEAESLLDAA